MTLFAELHLPDETTVDRVELEDAVIEAFGDLADVTGAGSGNFGSNLDIEFGDPASRDDIVGTVRTVLASLGVERARVRFEGSEEWISLEGHPPARRQIRARSRARYAADACIPFYRRCVTWASDYHFSDPLLDLRSQEEQAESLRAELLRELSAGHVLHGVDLRVIARALPQDDVVVETAGGEVALVHLTWTGHAESPPWPTTELLTSAKHFEQTIEFRY